jgi:hypothetical protein
LTEELYYTQCLWWDGRLSPDISCVQDMNGNGNGASVTERNGNGVGSIDKGNNKRKDRKIRKKLII